MLQMKTLIHRSQYMGKRATHSEYYGQFVTPGIIAMVKLSIGENTIKQSKDPHFNDIPLSRWDAFSQSSHIQATAKLLKECGDHLSLSAVVCIAKEAARQIKSL